MKPLPLLPSSASALAAARPGEVVTVRVFAEVPDVDERLILVERWPVGWVWASKDHPARSCMSATPPAAVGERVAVVPGCHCCGRPAACDGIVPGPLVEGVDPEDEVPMQFCDTCCSHDQQEGPCSPVEPLPATVTAAPEPETFCGTCEGEGYVRIGEVRAGVCVNINGEWWHERCEVCAKPCPTCRGTPSEHVWRVGVRREEA